MLKSNAIGKGAIGVASIGSQMPIDYHDTIYSQYQNSPVISAIIDAYANAVNGAKDYDTFFDKVWDLRSCTGYGLDVWGRILGVSRAVQVPAQWFGFQEGQEQPFNQGVFWSGNVQVTNYPLADAPYRRLLWAKAAANISDCSIASINRILMNLFPARGACFVTSTADQGGANSLALVYTFRFSLSPVELTIVSNGSVLPRPAGIAATVSTY